MSDSSYIDEDVEAGVTYHYVVRPQNEDGQGELTSYQASVVPGSSAELVIDNSEAELSGAWTTTNTERGYRGRDAAVAQSLEPCSDHLAVDAHVTASSVFDSARGPKNAVDGACADDSRWLSATDDPTPTLTIDLDSTTNIERLDVYSGFRWADINPAHVLVDFTIEAHTEAGWEQVAEFTDNTDSKASWEGQVAADRIRLVITDPSRTTPDVARIYEVAVHEASEDLATAVFPPGSEIVGDYSVWAWFPHGDANAASDAPFTVVHADGEDRVTVDQRGAGGYWHRLGNEVYTFDASAGHHVRLDNIADGYVVADAVRLLPAGETPTASYGVDWSDPRQVIEGMSVEILFDCLAPGGQENCTEERVPDTLTSSERERWYQDMLTGIRNIRLAMGLYLRGTDDEERLITSRYPGQLEDIAETAQESGADVTPTYWSPAPYFKSSDSFIGGGVRSFDNSTLADLADAMSTDITTLKEHGIPVRNWSLQNEPQNRPLNVSPGSYSMSYYAPADYVTTFKTVGSQIRSEHPEVRLFGPDTGKGTNWANAIASDPEIMELIDAWSWHLRPAELLTAPGTAWDNAQDRPQINTEFSYTGGGSDFTNTAKNILNHFIYYDSPTWYWLHALQPTNAGEFAANRALGVWRPPTDDDFSGEFSDLPVGHWRFIDHNWNPLAGFVKLMPHDSVRYPVLGENPKNDGQLMAFEGPDGERGVVILNDSDTPADFEIDLGDVHALSGHGFSLNDRFADLGTVEDDVLTTTLEPESLQFWVSEASS